MSCGASSMSSTGGCGGSDGVSDQISELAKDGLSMQDIAKLLKDGVSMDDIMQFMQGSSQGGAQSPVQPV